MSKVKSKDLGNVYGKKCGENKHMPKEISTVVGKLEKLDFVRHIVLGNFRNANGNSGIKIIGYDEKLRKYHINASVGKYEQKIFLDVSEKNADYETAIRRCF